MSPYNHQQKIAKYYWADEALLKKAADAAVAAQVRILPQYSQSPKYRTTFPLQIFGDTLLL